MSHHNELLPLNSQSNSWYLKIGNTHHFYCQCGQEDKVVTSILLNLYQPRHYCSRCTQSHYMDSQTFIYNTKVRYYKVFNWQYESRVEENGWCVDACFYVPLFDYSKQKIVEKRIAIASYALTCDGKEHYEEHEHKIGKKIIISLDRRMNLSKFIKEGLRDQLIDYVLQYPVQKISWIKREEIPYDDIKDELASLCFFLENGHLKSYDFLFWKHFNQLTGVSLQYSSTETLLSYVFKHRKEKSIKRAYLSSYQRAIADRAYNYTADYVFARVIEDRNYLLQCICIDYRIKNVLFQNESLEHIFDFFEIMSHYYSQRSLMKLLTSITLQQAENRLVSDTVRMCSGTEIKELILRHFRKPKVCIHEIHDELVRINNMQTMIHQYRVVFSYNKAELKAETEREGKVFCLPKTKYELADWAKKMRNCMLSYAKDIHRNTSTIYGVFEAERMLYAVEIQDRSIIQASGVNNSAIPDEDMMAIEGWFSKVYLKQMGKLRSLRK